MDRISGMYFYYGQTSCLWMLRPFAFALAIVVCCEYHSLAFSLLHTRHKDFDYLKMAHILTAVEGGLAVNGSRAVSWLHILTSNFLTLFFRLHSGRGSHSACLD